MTSSYFFSAGSWQNLPFCDVPESDVSYRWQTSQATILIRVHNYPSMSAYLNCLMGPLLLFPFSHVKVAITWFISLFRTFFKLYISTANLSDVDMIRVTVSDFGHARQQVSENKLCSPSTLQWPRDHGKKRTTTKYLRSPDNCSQEENLNTAKVHFNCRCFFSLTFMDNYSKHKRFGAKVYLSVYVWTCPRITQTSPYVSSVRPLLFWLFKSNHTIVHI